MTAQRDNTLNSAFGAVLARTASSAKPAASRPVAPPALAPVAQWRLQILEGPNAGAELALTPGPYRLGGAHTNDIVLSDPALQAEHLSLTISPASAAIIAHAPGVDLQRRTLALNTHSPLRAGSDIRVGSTLMRVHGPAARGGLLPGRAVLGCAAASGLAVAVAVFAAGTPGSPVRTEARAAIPAPVDTAGAAGALRARVADAGIAGNVSISADGHGALLAAGMLPASALPAWQGVRGWFDATYGSRVTLLERFDAPGKSAAPPLNVAAVALSPVPLVITRDGARYTEGAVLPGGWEVQSITGSAVTLRHDGQMLRITL